MNDQIFQFTRAGFSDLLHQKSVENPSLNFLEQQLNLIFLQKKVLEDGDKEFSFRLKKVLFTKKSFFIGTNCKILIPSYYIMPADGGISLLNWMRKRFLKRFLDPQV